MQNISISTTPRNYLNILFISIILLAGSARAATLTMDNWLNEPISISFQNEPLSVVLRKISEQTGVSIAYDPKLANEQVTGEYQNVKTSDAITRLFKSKNISIQVNTEKKAIIVKTFGAKKFIWTAAPDGKHNSSQMTLADLEQMHGQQYKRYKKRITDDNEILENGMTRGELKARLQQQYRTYQTRITNLDEDIGNGITRGELRTMHLEQYKAYQKRIANNNTPLVGETKNRSELQTLHKMQYKEYKERIANINNVTNGDTMTRGEIQSMHKMQYEQYKNRSKNQTLLKEP